MAQATPCQFCGRLVLYRMEHYRLNPICREAASSKARDA